MKVAVIQCPYFPRKKKISLKVSFDVSANYHSDRIYLGFPPNRITINSIIVIIAISIIIITTIVINIIIVILILSCTTFQKPVYFYFI